MTLIRTCNSRLLIRGSGSRPDRNIHGSATLVCTLLLRYFGHQSIMLNAFSFKKECIEHNWGSGVPNMIMVYHRQERCRGARPNRLPFTSWTDGEDPLSPGTRTPRLYWPEPGQNLPSTEHLIVNQRKTDHNNVNMVPTLQGSTS